jgi:hypothetical protein
MPLQNRVDPYGELHAVEARGAWLGNRGILHDDAKRIAAPWRLRRWITCVLRFKGRQRQVMTPHRYTELFFLDEATAYAAGHRPCAECRRTDFNAFRAAWSATNPARVTGARVSADQIDAVLHSERAVRAGGKRTYSAQLGTLPPGTMVEYRQRAHLMWDGSAWPWSFAGYVEPLPPIPAATEVIVLTPRSIVRAFHGGLQPQVHESASGWRRLQTSRRT